MMQSAATGIPARHSVQSSGGFPQIAASMFFAFSVAAFMAQAAVNLVAAPFEAVTGAPLQVVLVLLGALCLFGDRASLQWLLLGRGRLPLGLSLMTLVVVFYHDVSRAESFAHLRSSIQLLTGIAVYFVAFRISLNEKLFRNILRVWFVMTIATSAISMMEMVAGVPTPWAGHSGFGSGLEYSPVPLSYSIATPCTLAVVFALARTAPYANPGFLLSIATAGIGLGGLVAAASRSGLVGVVLGGALGFLLLGRNRRIGIATLVGIGAALIVGATGAMQYVMKAGVIGDARLFATWAVYLPVAITHPVGVGARLGVGSYEQYRGVTEARETLGLELDPETSRLGMSMGPHNAWLNAGLSYGWVGLVSLFWIYAYVALCGFRGLRRRDLQPAARVMLCGLLGALVAFVMHSSFHHSSIFRGEMRGFLLLG
ncbi:MAG: O-antigen ligase family protein, partial [Planctomycetota bacterium]